MKQHLKAVLHSCDKNMINFLHLCYMCQTAWKRNFFVRYCAQHSSFKGHDNWMWLLPTPDAVFSEVARSYRCDKHGVKSVTLKRVTESENRTWMQKQAKVYTRLYQEENIYMLHFALPLTSITLIAFKILKITALILLTIKEVTVKWRWSSCSRTMESTVLCAWLLAKNISVSF